MELCMYCTVGLIRIGVACTNWSGDAPVYGFVKHHAQPERVVLLKGAPRDPWVALRSYAEQVLATRLSAALSRCKMAPVPEVIRSAPELPEPDAES